jgi:hypothetical protein
MLGSAEFVIAAMEGVLCPTANDVNVNSNKK